MYKCCFIERKKPDQNWFTSSILNKCPKAVKEKLLCVNALWPNLLARFFINSVAVPLKIFLIKGLANFPTVERKAPKPPPAPCLLFWE